MTMNEQQKKIIETAQTNAILKKLQSGKVLTGREHKYLLDQAVGSDEPNQQGCSHAISETASNVNDLANRLGVHRQLIAYHRGRAGSPATLSVTEWRHYLLAFGKTPTAQKIDGTTPTSERDIGTDSAFATLFYRLSNSFPNALRMAVEVSGVKLPPRKHDLIAYYTWMLMAATYSALAKQHRVIGPFEAIDADGKCEYPEEIQKLAVRILNRKEPKPQAAQPLQSTGN
jgi:hypothetical protein